jgi:hypothetical protein
MQYRSEAGQTTYKGHEPERRTASLRSLFGSRRGSRAGARLCPAFGVMSILVVGQY